MDKRELDLHLKNQKNISSALFFGACDYLAELYANTLLQNAGDSADILKMYFDEYSFVDAKNFLSQSSLFGDRLVLLLKSDKKIPKTELKELLSIADKNNALFVYRFFGDLTNKDADYYKLFSSEQNGLFVRFFNPNSISESSKYIIDEAQKKALNISKDAAEELVNLKNGDLESAVKELDKFLAHDGQIGIRDIKALVEESDDAVIENLFDEVLGKKEFAKTLFRILERADFDEIRVILFFQNYIYELLLFLLYSQAYGTIDAYKITGRPLPEFIAKAKASKAIKMNLNSYSRILQTLLEADFELKLSKNSDKKAILLQYLIKLQNNL